MLSFVTIGDFVYSQFSLHLYLNRKLQTFAIRRLQSQTEASAECGEIIHRKVNLYPSPLNSKSFSLYLHDGQRGIKGTYFKEGAVFRRRT